MIDSNTAGVILAVATLVTSLGAGFAVVYNAIRNNAIRTKRVEAKIDEGAIVQGQIHTAVNSNLSNALAKIEAIGEELHAARIEIGDLKHEIAFLKRAIRGTPPPEAP